MIGISLLPHAEFGQNDHQEDALHFSIFVTKNSNDSNNWIQLPCIIPDHRYGTWLHVSHYKFMHVAASFITDCDEPS